MDQRGRMSEAHEGEGIAQSTGTTGLVLVEWK